MSSGVPEVFKPAVVLSLPYPVSANVYWRSRVVIPKRNGKSKREDPFVQTYVSPEADAFRDAVEDAVYAAGFKGEPIANRCLFELDLYPARPLDWRKRMRDHSSEWDDDVRSIDLGNADKVVCDALEHSKVIVDDKRLWVIVLARKEPDGISRCVVRLTPIPRLAEVEVSTRVVMHPQASLL